MKLNYRHFRQTILLLSLILATQTASAAGNFPATDSITPSQLVSAVLAANPKLKVVNAIWKAASARIAQQSALDDPSLSYALAPQTVNDAQSEFGQRIEISQKIPWPGQLRLLAEAAASEADAAGENVTATRLFLSSAAKSLFADWYYIHQAIKINRINQSLLIEFRDIAVSRYGAGLGDKQDALQASVEIALLERQAISLERERRTILARINTLLNRSPDAEIPTPSKLPPFGPLPDVKMLHEKALQSRPELKASAARVQTAKIQTNLSNYEYYPEIKLTAGYNTLWEDVNKRFTVGIGLSLPLDLRKRRAAEDESRAKMKQAEWEKIDLSAKIREEVQIIYDRAKESMLVNGLYHNKLLPLADENLEAATAAYRAGYGGFLTLIESEKNRRQTQLRAERALSDAYRLIAELENAVGSFEPPVVTTEGQGS
ncbi:MAG: TolC family protein [Gammaproteobacteria bacterium]